MARPLTARSVDKLKPDPAKRLEVPDGLLPGLYLIIQPSGARSWAVRYRRNGQTRKLTLGPYPTLTLAIARERARAALKAVQAGEDSGNGQADRLPVLSQLLTTAPATLLHTSSTCS
jgi:hypothetical protein